MTSHTPRADHRLDPLLRWPGILLLIAFIMLLAVIAFFSRGLMGVD